MKRIALLLAALMLFTLAGCSILSGGADDGKGLPEAAISIMEVLDDDMLAVYKNRDASLPAAVIYIFQGNGERVESPLYGEDSVNAALDAIAEITISGETDMTVADSDSSYTFVNADGTEAGKISFNGAFLECGGKKYEIGGKDALRSIDFPAETDRDMLSIDGPDLKLMEFLERCKTEAPVSVKVVRDGTERVITNAAAIDEALSGLYSIGLVRFAYQGAEEPATTLAVTFAMQDGAEYSLTLYDDSVYIYEYPAPLGIWSFYTDGAEYFIEALEKAE